MSSSINNMMAILLIASVAIVIGGLIAIPVIEAADAANAISDSRSKGKQGEIASQGKRQGNGGCGGGNPGPAVSGGSCGGGNPDL
jgi:hypothetical protein